MADGWVEIPSFDASMVSTHDAQGAVAGFPDIPEPKEPASAKWSPRDRLSTEAWAVSHPQTFAAAWNTLSRTYLTRFDEALSLNARDAVVMRKDHTINSCLQRRITPVTSLQHTIETDDPKDPVQRLVAQRVLKLLDATPRFQVMKSQLLEAIFYGRYGVQVMWGKKTVNGDPAVVVIDHVPLHGDKIVWKWSGVPGVMVNPTAADELRPSVRQHVEHSVNAWGPVLFLRTPALRRRFILHEHGATDQDYLYEADLAGAVRGLGVRGRLFHIWNIRNEILTWTLDALQRVGANGSIVAFFPQGNHEYRNDVVQALKDMLNEHVAAFPFRPGDSIEHLIKQIPVNPTGYDVLKVFADYFDMAIREVILGEQGPGSPINTRLAAELVEEGRFTLQRADANNLAETLTNDLVNPLVEFNRQSLEAMAGGPIRFDLKLKFQLDKPNSIEDLQAAQLLIGICQAMGVQPRIDVEALVDKSGLLPPENEDEEPQPTVMPAPQGAEAENPQGPGGFEANPRIRTDRPTENRGGDPSRYASDAEVERYGFLSVPHGDEPPSGAKPVSISPSSRPLSTVPASRLSSFSINAAPARSPSPSPPPPFHGFAANIRRSKKPGETFAAKPAPTVAPSPPPAPPAPRGSGSPAVPGAAVAPPKPPVSPPPPPSPQAPPEFRLSSETPGFQSNPKSSQGSLFVGGSAVEDASRVRQKPSLPGQQSAFVDEPPPPDEPSVGALSDLKPPPRREEILKGLKAPMMENPIRVDMAAGGRNKGGKIDEYLVHTDGKVGGPVYFHNVAKGTDTTVHPPDAESVMPKCSCANYNLMSRGEYVDDKDGITKRADNVVPNPAYECKHIKSAVGLGVLAPVTDEQKKAAWDRWNRENGVGTEARS